MTVSYYVTAAIGGLMPILESIAVTMMIDSLNKLQNGTGTALMIVMGIVILRFVAPFGEAIAYWGLNTSYLDYLFRYKLQNRVSQEFFRKLSSLDIGYFEDPKTQDLITKTRDTMQWRVPDMLRMTGYLFRNLVLVISAFAILAHFGWWVALLVLAAGLPRVMAQMTLGRSQWSIYGSGAPQAKKLWYFSWILAEPTAIKEIKIFQSAGYLMSRFKEIQEKLYNLNKVPLDKLLVTLLTLPIVELGVILGISWIFLNKLATGQLMVGDFILLNSAMLLMRGNVVGVSINLGEVYSCNLHVNDFFKVLALPSKVVESEKPVKMETDKPPRIEFKKVSFGYPNTDKIVLKDISLVVEPGENIALVGVNGAGKSTMVKLLCRFYDVTSGQILINGVDIREIKKGDLYKLMGTLFQEFMHYHFTVKENITMGAPDKKNKKTMEMAAEQSGAWEFVEKLPNKFETLLGKEFDDGEELSGGQWQKLAIARAFYEQSPLLILDEPTSAIDAEAEFEIFSNLQKIYRDKTLVLVSHRFSTVRNADKIFVIEEGKISEQGTHGQLLKKKGKYAKMFLTQAEGYKK